MSSLQLVPMWCCSKLDPCGTRVKTVSCSSGLTTHRAAVPQRPSSSSVSLTPDSAVGLLLASHTRLPTTRISTGFEPVCWVAGPTTGVVSRFVTVPMISGATVLMDWVMTGRSVTTTLLLITIGLID